MYWEKADQVREEILNNDDMLRLVTKLLENHFSGLTIYGISYNLDRKMGEVPLGLPRTLNKIFNK